MVKRKMEEKKTLIEIIQQLFMIPLKKCDLYVNSIKSHG